MKFVWTTVLIILLLVAGGLVYVYRNLGGLTGDLIERVGSDTLGVEVSVGSMDIDLGAGSAVIHDFRIANPEGFSAEDLMTVAQLDLGLDLASLRGDSVHITRIAARDPAVRVEMIGTRSNLDVLRQNLSSGAEPAPPETAEESTLRLIIDEIEVAGIAGTLQSDQLAQPVAIDLGDIRLRNLEGRPPEIAQQVLRPLLEQLSANVARQLLESSGVEERINEALDEAVGEDLRQGLGDLLRGRQQ